MVSKAQAQQQHTQESDMYMYIGAQSVCKRRQQDASEESHAIGQGARNADGWTNSMRAAPAASPDFRR